MRGTLVCALTEGEESADALEIGAELSNRLGLRLVLAHAVQGIDGITGGDGSESLTMQQDRKGAERRVSELAIAHGVSDRAEKRVAVGEPAALVAQIAAEEAADVIVVGARTRSWRRGLDSRLADELETETPVPVLIAPRRGRRTRRRASMNGGRR